jgi:hypothetical protein
MRSSLLSSIAFAAIAVMALGALVPAQAQQPRPPQQQQPRTPPQQQQPSMQTQQAPQDQQALAPPKPYKPVAIKLPQSIQDPTFAAFRKQLEGIAQRKDRAALARIVSQQFFWIPEDKDVADKRKSGLDNLSAALGLDDPDTGGWDLLLDMAAEPTAEPYPGRQGAICAPGEVTVDEKAAEDLANATQTDAGEWGYPASDGIQVRSGAAPNSPVIERLGLYLVRVYPDDSPAAAVQGDALRIVTPSGKLGFINADMLRPLLSDQLCYIKEANVWRIAGAIGGSSGDDSTPPQ